MYMCFVLSKNRAIVSCKEACFLHCVCVCAGICLPEGGGKGVPRPAHQSPHQRHVSPACVCRAEEANLLPPRAEHVQRTAAGEPETDTGREGEGEREREGEGREGGGEGERKGKREREREKRGAEGGVFTRFCIEAGSKGTHT